MEVVVLRLLRQSTQSPMMLEMVAMRISLKMMHQLVVIQVALALLTLVTSALHPALLIQPITVRLQGPSCTSVQSPLRLPPI